MVTRKYVQELREAQKQREQSTLEDIRKAIGPNSSLITPLLPDQLPDRNGPYIGHGVGATQLTGFGGSHVGWRPDAQTKGRPSKLMPVEKEVIAAQDAFFKQMLDSVPVSQSMSELGQLSATKRGQTPKLAEEIMKAWRDLEVRNVPVRNRVNLIQRQTGANKDYVREVLRKSGIALSKKKSPDK